MELTAATILVAFAGVFLICFMKGAAPHGDRHAELARPSQWDE